MRVAASPESSVALRPKRVSRALAATLATALLLAGGRWASYLGNEPVFLTDVLLLAAVFHRLLSRRIVGKVGSAAARRHLGGPVLALGSWALLRMVSGARLDITALRDFAPYLYIFAGFLSANAYSRSDPGQRQRTVRFLYYALLLHLCWVFALQLAPGLDQRMPALGDRGVRVFSLRSDFDAAVLGILTAYSLWMVLVGGSRRWHALVLIVSGALVLSIGSRAGLLGALAAVATSGWAATRRSAGVHPHRRFANRIAVAAVAVVLLLVLPSTAPGSRLIASIDPSGARTAQQVGAVGTTDARRRGWSTLQRYVEADAARQVIGVGFGPDFMRASGADLALLGVENDTVRSPHNYVLGTYARLGVIGAALWLWVLVQLAAAIARAARSFRSERLLLLAALIVVALVPVGLLGVVLESPFGAVPFYWAAGILLSHSTKGIIGRPALRSVAVSRRLAAGGSASPPTGASVGFEEEDPGPTPTRRKSE